MKNNIENIPNEVFEWMTSFTYDELDAVRKETVLLYFTRDEYNELYDSNVNIRKSVRPDERSHTAKADLMRLFDEKHLMQKQTFRLDTLVLWKAASVLLLLSTMWFAFQKSDEPISTNAVAAVKVDTVFVETPAIAMIPTKDTVYIEKNVEKIVVRNLPNVKQQISERLVDANTESEYAVIPNPDSDFQILSVSTIDNVSNTTRRNSMNDDSLEKNFKFVRM